MIDAAGEPEAINSAMEVARALPMLDVVNPYGDGTAARRIREVIEQAPGRRRLLSKTTTLV